MGYCMTQIDSEFFISAEKKEPAREALVKALGDTEEGPYKWVDNDWHQQPTLEKMLAAWNWEAVTDDAGNITDLCFNAEKAGDEDLLFRTIAPFVRTGSYISMRGEESSHWMWCFESGALTEKTGRLVYE